MPRAQGLADIEALFEAGTARPMVDGTYALSETPEAIRYLEQDHARGKVVITIRG